MFGTSFIVHIAAVLLFCWGAYEIIFLRKQRKLLLNFSGGNPGQRYFLLSPLYYIGFLARLFALDFKDKPMLSSTEAQKIRADRLFFFMSSKAIKEIFYRESQGEKIVTFVLNKRDESTLELSKNLSDDLGLKIEIK